MGNKETATKIVEKIGGKQNIAQAWHCITRLRFNLVNESKANIEELKKIDGVIGAQFQGEQLQVVIGNNVANVYTALMDIVGPLEVKGSSSGKNTNPIALVFDSISGIFNPILPAIIGAGLLKGLLTLFLTLNWISAESSEYFILNMISDGAFYFMPFLLAFSAAKKFKTNEYIAVSLAGILMYPSFSALEGGTKLKFLFFDIPAANYSSSVIPIILSVLLLSFVYRFLDKIVPNMLRMIFTPLLALLITAPISLFAISPLGNYAGIYVAEFFLFLFNTMGPVAGLLFAGFMPFIVMTGMHYAFFPITLDSMGRVGYDIMLLPMSLASNAAQCGATLGVATKTKDKTMKSVAFSCALSAAFGITEPAMYGVTLKLKKPMYCAMAGSAIGGSIYGFFIVKAFAFSIPGITSLPTYISVDHPNNFLYACAGIVLSFTIAFIATIFSNFEGSKAVTEINEDAQATKEVLDTNQNKEEIKILSPLSGKAIYMSTVEDKIFATEVLGKGIGIVPNSNQVIAPFDGTVAMVAETKHAIGVISSDGVELLIHIGINTVSMDGKGFTCDVVAGQEFKKGQVLLEFDTALIEQFKLSPVSVVIVTNSSEYTNFEAFVDKTVTAGKDLILSIK